MTDLVERLREAHPNSAQRFAGSHILLEAATAIETLTRKKAALEAERDHLQTRAWEYLQNCGKQALRAESAESALREALDVARTRKYRAGCERCVDHAREDRAFIEKHVPRYPLGG